MYNYSSCWLVECCNEQWTYTFIVVTSLSLYVVIVVSDTLCLWRTSTHMIMFDDYYCIIIVWTKYILYFILSASKVVDRTRRQLEKLWHTTNIYLHPNIHEFAEQLASKLPGDLKVCVTVYVCVCRCFCLFVYLCGFSFS